MRILAVAAVLPTLVIPTTQGPQRTSVSMTLPAEPVEVPMRMVNRRPLVDVRINGGGPYTFLIDTGGSGLARADTSLVEKLKLEVVGEARGAAGTGGQAVSCRSFAIRRWRWRCQLQGRRCALARLQRGARTAYRRDLGIGLFSTCLVTRDFARSVLRIEGGTLRSRTAGKSFRLRTREASQSSRFGRWRRDRRPHRHGRNGRHHLALVVRRQVAAELGACRRRQGGHGVRAHGDQRSRPERQCEIGRHQIVGPTIHSHRPCVSPTLGSV